MTVFFYIVATVYISLAGAPADTTGSKTYLQAKFETMDQCKTYLDSDAFHTNRTQLAEMLITKFKEPLPKLTIAAVCEKYPDDYKKDHPEVKNDGGV